MVMGGSDVIEKFMVVSAKPYYNTYYEYIRGDTA
jgi:hypothetical protein